ncbi:MAG: hypothetical protein K6E67_06575 [Prevotella sp.]|nr:hypothetical protein [Prevotella sp.]
MAVSFELSSMVEYCKQMPTYKDALPLISYIQEQGARLGVFNDVMEGVAEIRAHFGRKQEKADTAEKPTGVQEMLETPEMPELKFFYQVNDKQALEFKETLRQCLLKIDTTGKKEWFCPFIAWRYVQKQHSVQGGYVDFFSDIDALYPGFLKDVRKDLKGNRRLKPYCDMLAYEYNRWAVDNGCVPKMQVWAHSEWTAKYNNSKGTITRMQQLVRDFYKAFLPFVKPQ